MNIRHFFDNIDEKTIDIITEKYPPLSSDDKERLYAMSKNKYNSDIKNEKNNGTEVSGVERYHKPLWHKVLSAVAAAVVVVGGVGGGVLLLGKGGGVDPMTDIEATEPAEEEVTEAAEVEETEPEIEQADYDYTAIATELTDKFFYMIDVLRAYNVSYDKNDFITYNCYSVSNPATLSEKYGVDLSGAEEKTDFLYTRKLYKVTDDRFKSCQDIYNVLRELTSSSLLSEENYENADLPIYGNEWVTTPIAILGTDVSMYESGSNIYDSYFSDFENRKFDMQDSDNWEAALSAFSSHYVEYNGNLYIIGDMGYSDMPDVHVNLQNVEENRFSVTRKHIISYEDETERIESYNFDFVFENGEWKIDNVERVVSDEEAIGNAIASYVDTLIRSDTDKYGNIYENPDVFDFGFEIVSYNGENNCTARVILTDYDYVDIIELTAEIDIKEQKVINAEIIELQ